MDELLQKDFVETKLYRNNLKNREFGKEGPQNFCSERATIAYGQGANENTNSEVNPMDQGSPKTQRLWSRALLKPDSSSCFSISVEFQNYTFIECAIDAVRLISNPHIILWY